MVNCHRRDDASRRNFWYCAYDETTWSVGETRSRCLGDSGGGIGLLVSDQASPLFIPHETARRRTGYRSLASWIGRSLGASSNFGNQRGRSNLLFVAHRMSLLTSRSSIDGPEPWNY